MTVTNRFGNVDVSGNLEVDELPLLSMEKSAILWTNTTPSLGTLTVTLRTQSGAEPAGYDFFPVWWFFRDPAVNGLPVMRFESYPIVWQFASPMWFGVNTFKMEYQSRLAGIDFRFMDQRFQPTAASMMYEVPPFTDTVFDTGTGDFLAKVVFVSTIGGSISTDIDLVPAA